MVGHQDNKKGMWESLSQGMRLAAEPIRKWLEDPNVIEIMCNGPGHVWIETLGVPLMEHFEVPALTKDAIERLAFRVAGNSNQHVNGSVPLLSAAMANGERFQAALAPASPHGGAFAIRKAVISEMTLDDYLERGGFETVKLSGPRQVDPEFMTDTDRDLVDALRDDTAIGRRNWLKAAIQSHTTMMFAGGTSGGKTTLLNACLKEVPLTERICTMEDTRELKPPQPNWLSLIASKGDQGLAKVTIQMLLEAALRFRPDRLLLGEIRGAEAFSYLQAVNTGHPGSMSSIHADNPWGAYERTVLATMQAGLGLSKTELMEFIRMVVPVVIQVGRNKVTGRRGISEIYFNKWSATHELRVVA